MAVDVRTGARTVVIDTRAADEQSGVASVEVEVDGAHVTHLPARLVAGTRRHGTWRTTLRLSACAVAGSWIVRVVGITDRRGRRYDGYQHPTTSGRNLGVVNGDRAVPTMASQTVDDHGVRVAFTEDVVGISGTSAGIYYNPYGFDSLGSRLTGGWQCADVSGAAVDCLRGPTRTATFVSDQPLPPGGSYVTVINPEHVLDVTDLAGNPYGDARRIG
jgi:hypothetical protein